MLNTNFKDQIFFSARGENAYAVWSNVEQRHTFRGDLVTGEYNKVCIPLSQVKIQKLISLSLAFVAFLSL